MLYTKDAGKPMETDHRSIILLPARLFRSTFGEAFSCGTWRLSVTQRVSWTSSHKKTSLLQAWKSSRIILEFYATHVACY